jgi:hypothetical protein
MKIPNQKAWMRLPLLLFAVLASVCLSADAAFAASYSDTDGHWGAVAIERWSDYDVLRGNGDGSFAPDRAMTPDELASVLTNAFGYTARYDGALPEYIESWAGAEEIMRKAVAASVIEPAEAALPLTRELAAKILAKAFDIAPQEGETKFADDAAVSAAYKPYVAALGRLGAFNGNERGEFMPTGAFSRAQILQVLDNTVTDIVNTSRAMASSSKSVIVNKPGLTLTDGTIAGDLIIGQGVGDGDVTLDGTSVEGRLIVYGGGSHSIIIKGGSKVAAIIVGKPNVHIKLENGVSIQSVEIVGSDVQITVQKGASIETLTIGADGATVTGEGALSSVTVKQEAVGAVVKTPNTIIINNSEFYVTTANGAVKAGDTQTTPAPSAPTGGNGGSYTPAPLEPAVIEISTASALVSLIKSGTENTSIIVTKDMTITKELVGRYEPFDAYDLLLRSNLIQSFYIPEGVTLTMEQGVTFRVESKVSLEIDGTLSVYGFWVGGNLTVNGVLYCSSNGLMLGKGATVGGSAASIAGVSLPEKSYGYNISFDYVDGVYTNGTVYWANAATEEQLRDAVGDAISSVNIHGSFDINAPIAPKLWVIEDDAAITVKSDFTVQGELNVAGEISGDDGGRVILPANAQIRNVLWGGGWLSTENGTGVLHGLPVDSLAVERIYIWQNNAWTLQTP